MNGALLLFTVLAVGPFTCLAGQLELSLFTTFALLALQVEAAQTLFVLTLLTTLGRFSLGALLFQLGGVLACFPFAALSSFALLFTLLASQTHPFIALGLHTLGLFTVLTLDAFKRGSDRAPVGQSRLGGDDQQSGCDCVNSDADQVTMERRIPDVEG